MDNGQSAGDTTSANRTYTKTETLLELLELSARHVDSLVKDIAVEFEHRMRILGDVLDEMIDTLDGELKSRGLDFCTKCDELVPRSELELICTDRPVFCTDDSTGKVRVKRDKTLHRACDKCSLIIHRQKGEYITFEPLEGEPIKAEFRAYRVAEYQGQDGIMCYKILRKYEWVPLKISLHNKHLYRDRLIKLLGAKPDEFGLPFVGDWAHLGFCESSEGERAGLKGFKRNWENQIEIHRNLRVRYPGYLQIFSSRKSHSPSE